MSMVQRYPQQMPQMPSMTARMMPQAPSMGGLMPPLPGQSQPQPQVRPQPPVPSYGNAGRPGGPVVNDPTFGNVQRLGQGTGMQTLADGRQMNIPTGPTFQRPPQAPMQPLGAQASGQSYPSLINAAMQRQMQSRQPQVTQPMAGAPNAVAGQYQRQPPAQ